MKSKKITLFSLASLIAGTLPISLAISCAKNNGNEDNKVDEDKPISEADLEAKIEANVGDVSKSEFKDISLRLKKEKNNIRKYKKIKKIDEEDYEIQLAWENISHILDDNFPDGNINSIKINNYNYDLYDLYENVAKALPMIKLPKSKLNAKLVIEKLQKYFSDEEIDNLSLEGLINLLINKRRIIKYALEATQGQKIRNITLIRKIVKIHQYFKNNEEDAESIEIENSVATKVKIKKAIKQIINKLELIKEEEPQVEDEENKDINPSNVDQGNGNSNEDKNEKQPTDSEENEDNGEESPSNNVSNASASALFYKPSNHTRVAHWNIKNYGSEGKKGKNSSSNPNGLKVINIAKAIIATQMDIIGITEVNYGRLDKIKIIVDKLNELTNTKDFAYIGVTNVPGVNPNSDQNEDVAIIYKKSIATPIAFDNNKIGASFTDPISFNNRKYARPPFGAMFKIKGYQKPIITIFAHFDSPGPKESNGEPKITEFDGTTIKGQGEYEVYESLALPEVFNFFASIAQNKDAAIVFGGDTNIKTPNHTLFQKLEDKYNLKNYYYNLKDGDAYKSSLGTTNKYVNPYDKILFKENKDINFIDAKEKEKIADFKNVPFKLDTVGAFKNNIWDLEESRRLDREYGKGETSELKLAITVSDHAPVMIDFKPKSA